MPSNHLILCCPLLLLPSIFSRIRVFSNESALCIRWPKFQLQHQSFQWTLRTDLFRMDLLGLLAVLGTLKSLLQYHSSAKSLQSCLTLCDPIDTSPPGSPVPGILQVRTLEWAISFSNAWKWKVKVKSLSRVRLLATPWTAAYQAPPSMGFSRQEYWSGVPLPSPTPQFKSINSSLLSFLYSPTLTSTHDHWKNHTLD